MSRYSLQPFFFGLLKDHTDDLPQDCVISQCDLAIEYLASFKLSQLGLALTNHNLLLLEAGVKTVHQVQPTAIKVLRSAGRGVRTIKRAGARRAGTPR